MRAFIDLLVDAPLYLPAGFGELTTVQFQVTDELFNPQLQTLFGDAVLGLDSAGLEIVIKVFAAKRVRRADVTADVVWKTVGFLGVTCAAGSTSSFPI